MYQLSSLNRVMAAANHLKNSAMEADTISKNGRSSKSQMSRGRIFIWGVVLFFLSVITAAPIHAQYSILSETATPPLEKHKVAYEYILNLETLKEQGYEKQIILWDFLPNTNGGKMKKYSKTAFLNDGNYAYIVGNYCHGMWVNYEAKVVLFLLSGKGYGELEEPIPFDKFIEVRSKDDSFMQSSGKRTGFYTQYWVKTNTVSKEVVKGVEVSVVTKGTNGVKTYKMYFSNSSADAVSCAQSIVDELNYIISNL